MAKGGWCRHLVSQQNGKATGESRSFPSENAGPSSCCIAFHQVRRFDLMMRRSVAIHHSAVMVIALT